MDLVHGGRLTGIELTGHATIQNRKRTRANVFRQLEILVKAQTERLEVIWRWLVIELVIPAIDDGLAFGYIADCGFPAIARCETASLHNAAARKTKEPGVHVSKQLDQIPPKSVGSISPGIERK